jgi:hypothetical protein
MPEYDPGFLDKWGDEGMGAASGAMSGAAFGSTIAPGWGTAIGAGVGGIAGWIASRNNSEQEEQFKLQQEIDKDKATLRAQAESGVTPELRMYARRAAQARAALGSKYSDRRLSPEQKARLQGNASANLSASTSQGMAEMQRSGRERAQQQLRVMNQQEKAQMQAQQQRANNAKLNLATTAAALMAKQKKADALTGATTNAADAESMPVSYASDADLFTTPGTETFLDEIVKKQSSSAEGSWDSPLDVSA